jgi:hypothetical protein
MITERIPEFFLLLSISLLTVTGAAWNLFLVNTAAAAHGVSDVMNARSGALLFVAFTPTCVPDTKKPLGYVPLVGTYFCFAAGIEPSTGAE